MCRSGSEWLRNRNVERPITHQYRLEAVITYIGSGSASIVIFRIKLFHN